MGFRDIRLDRELAAVVSSGHDRSPEYLENTDSEIAPLSIRNASIFHRFNDTKPLPIVSKFVDLIYLSDKSDA